MLKKGPDKVSENEENPVCLLVRSHLVMHKLSDSLMYGKSFIYTFMWKIYYKWKAVLDWITLIKLIHAFTLS